MRNYFKSFIKIMIALTPLVALSQELPEVIPPSPTVANLMQFEEIPISYYTGQPNISIPLHSKSLNGDLNFNMVLSYNTQGIKVNSISGWTGTGWNLLAAGSISRTVRDAPDELKKNSSGYYGVKTGVFHLDDYWNYDNLTTNKKQEFDYKAVGTSLNDYDADVDLYQFNFMGISGRFVIVKENGVFVPKLISKGQALKIEFVMDSTTKAINSFTLTDAKGYIYEFNTVEQSTSSTTFGSQAQGTQSTFNFNIENALEIFTINSAWHLSSVKTSNGISLVNFSYVNKNEAYTVSITETKNIVKSLLGIIPNTENLNEPCTVARLKPYRTVSWLNNSSVTKKLSSVIFKDGTSVQINTSNNHPETGGVKLASIDIKNAIGTINKSYNMTYETTTENTTTNTSTVQTKRLWLTKITETAGAIDYDYTLTYNNKNALPGFNSKYQDDWGYFSGIGQQTSCGGSYGSVYSESIIKTGLLSSISYPSGGVKEFDFEHHTYSYYGNNILGIDDYLKNPRNQESQSEDVTYSYNNSINISNLPDALITKNLDFAQSIFINNTFTGPSQFMQNHRLSITDGSGTIRYVNLNANCTVIPVSSGNLTIKFEFTSQLTLDPYIISGDIQLGYYQYPSGNNSLREEMIGGGVRIKSITFRETPLSTNKVVNYYYEDDTNSIKSSGVIDAQLDRLTRNYSTSQSYVNLENGNGNVVYDVKERGNRAQLSQGEYVGYRSVKVSETGNGYTIYNHTSAYDYPSPINVFSLPNPYPAPNLDYKRGLLTGKRVHREDGNILQEVSYYDDNNILKYNFIEDALFTARIPFKNSGCPWFVYYDHWASYNSGYVDGSLTSCDPSPTFIIQNCSGNIFQNTTIFKSGWAYPTEVITTDYFYEGSTVTSKKTKQTYSYNNLNYQISSENSYYDKGGTTEHILNEYFYPVGANLGKTPASVRTKMVDLNMVNTVLETRTFRNPTITHSLDEKINETHNIYHQFHPDLVALKEIKTEKEDDGVVSRIQFHNYDTHGNILEVSKTNGAHISYLWGHNKTRPIAQLNNAKQQNIPSSFKNITGNFTIGQENNLRNTSTLSSAMISFYRYDPIKGVISTSDDKGYITSYEYDAFNRLKRVKDADGNIIGENTYNYINQY